MNKNQNTLMIIVAIVVVIAGAVLFMNMKNNRGTELTTTTQTGDMVVEESGDNNTAEADKDVEMVEDSEVRTIAIEAGSFYYKPAEIKVKKGEKIKIVMTSKDMMHDFMIDELNVKLPVTKSGETNSVEFTPTKTGTFEYYCSVGEHRKNGQIGTIIVE